MTIILFPLLLLTVNAQLMCSFLDRDSWMIIVFSCNNCISFFISDVPRSKLVAGKIIAVYPQHDSSDAYWLAKITAIKKQVHGVYFERLSEKHFTTGGPCKLSLRSILRPQKGVKRFFLVNLSDSIGIGDEADRFLRSFNSLGSD